MLFEDLAALGAFAVMFLTVTILGIVLRRAYWRHYRKLHPAPSQDEIERQLEDELTDVNEKIRKLQGD